MSTMGDFLLLKRQFVEIFGVVSLTHVSYNHQIEFDRVVYTVARCRKIDPQVVWDLDPTSIFDEEEEEIYQTLNRYACKFIFPTVKNVQESQRELWLNVAVCTAQTESDSTLFEHYHMTLFNIIHKLNNTLPGPDSPHKKVSEETPVPADLALIYRETIGAIRLAYGIDV